jgi:hypothetical protein
LVDEQHEVIDIANAKYVNSTRDVAYDFVQSFDDDWLIWLITR